MELRSGRTLAVGLQLVQFPEVGRCAAGGDPLQGPVLVHDVQDAPVGHHRLC